MTSICYRHCHIRQWSSNRECPFTLGQPGSHSKSLHFLHHNRLVCHDLHQHRISSHHSPLVPLLRVPTRHHSPLAPLLRVPTRSRARSLSKTSRRGGSAVSEPSNPSPCLISQERAEHRSPRVLQDHQGFLRMDRLTGVGMEERSRHSRSIRLHPRSTVLLLLNDPGTTLLRLLIFKPLLLHHTFLILPLHLAPALA
jgi:hypothetical protein